MLVCTQSQTEVPGLDIGIVTFYFDTYTVISLLYYVPFSTADIYSIKEYPDYKVSEE